MFLSYSDDKRPGLVHSAKTAREIEKEKKHRESNEKNKAKPKKVLEQEKRSEGLSTAISSDNKGFSLLQKMGYKPGMVLGKRGKLHRPFNPFFNQVFQNTRLNI